MLGALILALAIPTLAAPTDPQIAVPAPRDAASSCSPVQSLQAKRPSATRLSRGMDSGSKKRAS